MRGVNEGESAGSRVVTHRRQLRCAHKVRVVKSVQMTKLAGHLAGARGFPAQMSGCCVKGSSPSRPTNAALPLPQLEATSSHAAHYRCVAAGWLNSEWLAARV